MDGKLGKEAAMKRLLSLKLSDSESNTFSKVKFLINQKLFTKAHLLMDKYDKICFDNKTMCKKIALKTLKETSLFSSNNIIYEAVRNMIEYGYLIDAYILMKDYDEKNKYSDSKSKFFEKNTKVRYFISEKETIEYIVNIESRKYNNTKVLHEIIGKYEISFDMRRVAITWLFQLENKDEVKYITTIHAQQYLDRFLCLKHDIKKFDLQLYAVASYSVAHKMVMEHDVQYDHYEDRMVFFSDMTNLTYSPKRITLAEIEILSVLNYDLLSVSTDEILNFMLKNTKIKGKVIPLKNILLILCIIEKISIDYEPSVLAHSIIYIISQYEKGFDRDVCYFHSFDKFSECSEKLKFLFIRIYMNNVSANYKIFYEFYDDEIEKIRLSYGNNNVPFP